MFDSRQAVCGIVERSTYGSCSASKGVARGKPKVLEPYYSTNGIVSYFVEIPRLEKVENGFTRCLFCPIDLTIATRGLTTIHGHWREAGHQSLEI